MIDSKEEACQIINSKIEDEWNNTRYPFLRVTPQKVQVPIYQKKYKLFLLRILKTVLKRIAFPKDLTTNEISIFDFSKIIRPDSWKEYTMSSKDKLAFPKFMTNHKYCFEVNLRYSFYLEDLSFGLRPTLLPYNTMDIGGGPLLIDKNSQKVYCIGSGIWIGNDYIKEYELYKESKASILDWDMLETYNT